MKRYLQPSPRILYILLPLLLLGLVAFRPEGGMDPAAFVSWYKEHRQALTREQQSGEVLYAVTFIPEELGLIKLAKRNELDKASYEEYRNGSKGTLSFQLNISVPAMGTKEFLQYNSGEGKTYEEKLAYYSFELQQDIVAVIDGSDTIHCSDYVFERSFSISPNGTMSLGFKVPKQYKTIALLVNDKGFNLRPAAFTYTRKELHNLPKLKKYTQWN